MEIGLLLFFCSMFAFIVFAVVVQLFGAAVVRFVCRGVRGSVRIVRNIVSLNVVIFRSVRWFTMMLVTHLLFATRVSCRFVHRTLATIVSSIPGLGADSRPPFKIPVTEFIEVLEPRGEEMPQSRQVNIGVIRSIALCCLAPTVVFLTFVGLSGAAGRNWPFDFAAAKRFWQIATNSHSAVPLQKNAYRTSTIASEPFDASPDISDLDLGRSKPGWIFEGESKSGDIQRFVLTSQLWNTEAEANHELTPKAGAILTSDFEKRHHGIFDPKARRALTTDRIVQVAVKNRFVERVESDFGAFKAPMNRVWWQVEVSPIVRTELYPDWTAATIQERSILLGTAIALITLIANAWSLIMVSRTKDCNWRLKAGIGTVVATTACWSTACLYLTSQLIS